WRSDCRAGRRANRLEKQAHNRSTTEAQPKHNRRAVRRSLTRGGGRAAFARGECSTLAILNDLVRARRSRPH
ncbi:hypothetical protein, partial [Burkholderia pseudomallei]|uniref:hypothetical protein n=1 Tax=Burkholderia pseudomallei TaxID=28450 RepID=UPI001060D615